jgi:hypothetical protein
MLMVLTAFMKSCLLAATLASAALSTPAFGQTTPPKTGQGMAQAEPYQSAFGGYRPYTEEPVANWKAANDTVANIGGWREYAKQAQADDATPTSSQAPGTQPALNPATKAKP